MEHSLALVIGGAGAVGTLFSDLLLTSYQRVVAIDLHIDSSPKVDGVEYIQGDITNPEFIDLLHKSTLVLLCIPEDPALNSLKMLASNLNSGQCLVDTLSVKTTIVKRLSELKLNCEALSINPMFGPSLGFKDQSVASVSINSGQISEHFTALIRKAGASVTTYTAEQHDRYTAITQAATHAAILSYAMTMQTMGYDANAAKPIWTPPHKTLLALLARILSADPEVYRDIQTSNPYAAEARNALQKNLKQFNHDMLSQDAEQFTEQFESLKKILQGNLSPLTETCKDIFKTL